jgi:hypothetical protein
VFDYDDSVPVGLVARWNRVDQDRAVLVDLALLLLTAAAGVVVAAALAGLAFDVPIGAAALAAAGAVLVGALAAVGRRILIRRGILLRPADMDLLVTRRVEVRFAGADSATDEAELAARARMIAADVITAPAWSSELLDGHPEQLDPVEEARQIHVAALRLLSFRSRLGDEPTGDDPLAAHLNAEWRHLYAQAQTTLAGLAGRVAALEQYWADLLTLSETLDRRTRLAELRAIGEEHGAVLARDQAANELATDRVTALDLQATQRRAHLRSDGEPATPESWS